MVEPYKPLYTVKEVSKVLLVNINKVYDFMDSGQLPYLMLGMRKIRGGDLENFIEKYPVGTHGVEDQEKMDKSKKEDT